MPAPRFDTTKSWGTDLNRLSLYLDQLVGGNLPITLGNVTPGGSGTGGGISGGGGVLPTGPPPSVPAGFTGISGIDNNSQTNNGYILLNWNNNPSYEGVSSYEILMFNIGQLTVQLNSGTIYTSITVNSIPYLLRTGSNIQLGSGMTVQVANDTPQNFNGGTINVTSFTADQNYPVTTTVFFGTTSFVAFVNTFKIGGLYPGLTYRVQLRAVGSGRSAWTSQLGITIGYDTLAPAIPTGLTATSLFRIIGLQWNANTEVDFDHYELQSATASGGPWTTFFVGNGTLTTYDTATSGTTNYFRIRAVDTSGNTSAYSSSVSTTGALIATGDIGTGQISTGNIAAAAVNTSKLANNAVTNAILASNSVSTANIQDLAVANAKIASAAVQAGNLAVVLGGGNFVKNSGFTDTTLPYISGVGTTAIIYTSDSTDGVFDNTSIKLIYDGGSTGYEGFGIMDNSIPVLPSTKYTISGYYKSVSGALTNMAMAVDWMTSANAYISTNISVFTGTTSWARYSNTYTSPANAAFGRPYFLYSGGTAGDTMRIDAIQFEVGDVPTAWAPNATELLTNTVGTNNIAANAITTGKIAAGAVIAATIAANTITAAQIASGTITGDRIAANTLTTTNLTVGSFQDSAVPNSSFEDYAAGFPYSWYKDFENGGTGPTYAMDTASPQSGAADVQIISTTVNFGSIVSESIPVVGGESYYVSVWIKSNVATTQGLYIRTLAGLTKNFGRNDTGVVGADLLNASNSAAPTTWTQYSGIWTIPAGKTWLRVALYNYAPNVNATFSFDNVEVRKAVGTANILDAAINSAKIANLAVGTAQIGDLSVTNLKINDVSFAKLTAGNILAFGTVTSGGFQTGPNLGTTGGAGVIWDSAGIRAYNSSNIKTIELKASDGSGTFLGAITSGSTISGAAMTAGSIAGSVITANPPPAAGNPYMKIDMTVPALYVNDGTYNRVTIGSY